MNILEIQEQVLELKQRMNEIISTGEQEVRELNEDETNELAEIRTKIDTLEEEIKTKEEENRQITKVENKENKEIRTMNLINMINAVLEGRQFSEDEVKTMAEARAEFAKSGINTRGQIAYRGVAATVEGAGKEATAITAKAISRMNIFKAIINTYSIFVVIVNFHNCISIL